MTAFRRIGVVGCGLMGAGIAEICARSRVSVVVAVRSPDAEARGFDRIAGSLDRARSKGKITASESTEALARITFTTTLDDLADRDLIIEAVREEASLKLDLLATLDKIVENPDAVLASNTSSLPIARLASATGRPGHVVGVHFFNPVPVLPLVELVAAVHTGRSHLHLRREGGRFRPE
ncbi:MAG: fadB1 [Amycolatopsis sp.]|jgi:3-hydroxybutyryl-CoA dehydrogenase|uniref:3-hydroxyacyl-CoA dehydrogenase NAD-binding domain-containing protein n=1 Tax=Amycolatopsis sp. TaxID=37632 RepID=UPI00260C1B5B|nr:3-hydroxyacyl-CoA dehydrogenase NAD-binding domain-containing protein [Amycolatopsis sp.]MCU1679797.1 fadB1 [Amycolatopsis sp.]